MTFPLEKLKCRQSESDGFAKKRKLFGLRTAVTTYVNSSGNINAYVLMYLCSEEKCMFVDKDIDIWVFLIRVVFFFIVGVKAPTLAFNLGVLYKIQVGSDMIKRSGKNFYNKNPYMLKKNIFLQLID